MRCAISTSVDRTSSIRRPRSPRPPAATAARCGSMRSRPARCAPTALIVTRRDPAASRPPAAYRLQWQGDYYQVWVRRPAHCGRSRAPRAGRPARPRSAAQIGLLAAAGGPRARIVASSAPLQVAVALGRAAHPRRWGHERGGLVMNHPGTLSAAVVVPFAGAWQLWVRGQLMAERAARARRRQARHALRPARRELAGARTWRRRSRVRLAAGRHVVSVRRGGFTPAPGDGGAAVLDGIVLTPAGAAPRLLHRRRRALARAVRAALPVGRAEAAAPR